MQANRGISLNCSRIELSAPTKTKIHRYIYVSTYRCSRKVKIAANSGWIVYIGIYIGIFIGIGIYISRAPIKYEHVVFLIGYVPNTLSQLQ